MEKESNRKYLTTRNLLIELLASTIVLFIFTYTSRPNFFVSTLLIFSIVPMWLLYKLFNTLVKDQDFENADFYNSFTKNLFKQSIIFYYLPLLLGQLLTLYSMFNLGKLFLMFAVLVIIGNILVWGLKYRYVKTNF
ncbi:hypothetical protein OAT67_07625 [Bacteriovoracaceae bacterium]|nr:hypothetical protein [Bacteriovoracaceae bacterium]